MEYGDAENTTTPGNTSFSNSTTEDAPSLSYNRYFQVAVVCIGIVGTFANGLVLYVLVSSKDKKTRNTLILNQTTLDFFGCVSLIVTYTTLLVDPYLEGISGWFICEAINDEIFIWTGLNGSTSGLVIIALERYWKIVHPISNRKYFRKWMAHVAIAACWINGALVNIPPAWVTTRVVDGKCLSSAFWPNPGDGIAFGIFYVAWEFFLPMAIFIFTYWHILLIIKRSVKTATVHVQVQPVGGAGATNSTGPPEPNAKLSRTQMNVTITFIIVTIFFVICWLPNDVFFLMLNLPGSSLQMGSLGWNATLVLIYINVSVNPLIYAAQYDTVKRDVRRLIRRLLCQPYEEKRVELSVSFETKQ